MCLNFLGLFLEFHRGRSNVRQLQHAVATRDFGAGKNVSLGNAVVDHFLDLTPPCQAIRVVFQPYSEDFTKAV
jgi:hypothetical protein